MSEANREPSISITLGYEGGYTNNPKDPGGPTNWGITIHDARTYWRPGATAEDVRAMPKSAAIEIYRKRYWAVGKISCDDEPAGVDLSKFDYRVNSGMGRADPDLESVRRPGDPAATVRALCRKRLNFLQHLRTWSTFGKGWGSRVHDVEARSVKMALEAQGHSPAEVKKTLTEEASKATSAAAKGTVVTAASGAALHHFDLSSSVVLALLLIPLAVLIVWSVWHKFQRAQAYTNVANT